MGEYEHGGPAKMGAQAKAVVAILVVIAIVIPIALGAALVSGSPYFSKPPTVSTTTSSSSSGTPDTVYLPQGAGSGTNFSPSSITVPSGTTITFVDQDTVAPHNVYFTSVPNGAANPNPANVPVLTNGDTYTVTLTTPGTYTFICQFHPGWMQGTIVVTG